jgi:hypothetical protein
VVSGQHVHRHRKRREQLAHALVLASARIGDQIAADQDGIGWGREAKDGLDRGRQRPRRAAVAAPDDDVGIAELREEGQTFFTWS